MTLDMLTHLHACGWKMERRKKGRTEEMYNCPRSRDVPREPTATAYQVAQPRRGEMHARLVTIQHPNEERQEEQLVVPPLLERNVHVAEVQQGKFEGIGKIGRYMELRRKETRGKRCQWRRTLERKGKEMKHP